jgi:hypothetical protein
MSKGIKAQRGKKILAAVPSKKQCDHYGQVVQVGPFAIMAGGTNYFRPGDLDEADLLVPLTHQAGPLLFSKRYQVLAGCLVDFGGVPVGWRAFLETVIDELKNGRKILAFCVGSHGRTGCFLASLIALLESDRETPDPIAAVRKRHCDHAIETLAQAEAIFALRKQPLPEIYRQEFARRTAARAAYPLSSPQPKV